MDKGTMAILTVSSAMLLYVLIHLTLWRKQDHEQN